VCGLLTAALAGAPLLRLSCVQWISSLRPLALTLISQELESTALPFLPRFRDVLHGAYAIFSSNDFLGTSSGCWDNIFAVEETMLGRGFVNQVACEGPTACCGRSRWPSESEPPASLTRTDCAVLYCTVLYCEARHGTVWYGTVRYVQLAFAHGVHLV